MITKFNFKDEKFIDTCGVTGTVILLLTSIWYVLQPAVKFYHIILWLLGIAGLGYYLYSRWGTMQAIFSRRATKYGANVLLTTIAVLGILFFVQAIAIRHHWQLDLTKNKRFTLSDQTQKVVKGLKKEVKAICFLKPNKPGRRETEDLLRMCSRCSPWFKFEFVDPDRKPAIARRYQITSYYTLVLETAEREEKITSDINEEVVTNSLLRVLRPEKKTVYFVKGHGEKSVDDTTDPGYSQVKKFVESQNYNIKDILLLQSATVPADASVLIIAGPTKDFLSPELETLNHYLKNNGKILCLLEAGFYLPQIKSFLKKFGVIVGDDVIIDRMSRMFGGDLVVPIVSEYSAHEITKNFRVATIFPFTRSLDAVVPNPEGVSVSILARTSQQSYAKTDLDALKKGDLNFRDGQDKPGPIPVLIAVNVTRLEGKETKSRIVVFGDSEFVVNANIALAGNKDLFMNTVSWLAEESELISIRPKEQDNQPLMLSAVQGRILFWIPVILIPLSVLGSGIYVIVNRRRK